MCGSSGPGSAFTALRSVRSGLCVEAQLVLASKQVSPSCLLLISVANVCDVEKMESEKVDTSCFSTLPRKVVTMMFDLMMLTNTPPLFVINILDIES